MQVAEQLAASWGMTWARTPADEPAAVDGCFLKQGTIVAVAELKVRQHDRATMQGWGDTYLITHAKLAKGRETAALLRVPFVVCAYLEPDQTVYWWQVADEVGEYALEFETTATTTQRAVNGGTTVRLNSFLPFEKARSRQL